MYLQFIQKLIFIYTLKYIGMVLVPIHGGGFGFEIRRTYQYTVPQMYAHFIKSDYGERLRQSNKNKDLSEKKFRELICPCISLAKQIDTADETKQEMTFCVEAFETMRKKNKDVKAQIEKCSKTNCSYHKKDTEGAEAYRNASKSVSHFLHFLLCPPIERDELAIVVKTGPDNFRQELSEAYTKNIKAANDKAANKKAEYLASNGNSGIEPIYIYSCLDMYVRMSMYIYIYPCINQKIYQCSYRFIQLYHSHIHILIYKQICIFK
jgi:hypothetical protein